MTMSTEAFVENSSAALRNQDLQKRLRVLNDFTSKRNAAFAELSDGEAWRDRARAIKEKTIANLETYLLQLEKRILDLGGTVHWADHGEDACLIILELARKNNVKQVVKSKSMVTEEIGLNEALEGHQTGPSWLERGLIKLWAFAMRHRRV